MPLKIGPVVLLAVFLSACSTVRGPHAGKDVIDIDDGAPMAEPGVPLQSRLGMNRMASDLGFAEKRFNSCQYGDTTDACGTRHFTVIHFQLLCRDSEGTVQNAPVHLTPLKSENVLWKIGGLTGPTRTDLEGYGQFTVLSDKSVRGQRLMLRIGKQFMGFTASEVTKVVLPRNFCG
ncbi:MAG TPA: hypothetical protein PKC28_01210 [Bdellovibrionales bacterium]|nr:hypothetical protein [Bdellovibrionales bacterium]